MCLCLSINEAFVEGRYLFLSVFRYKFSSLNQFDVNFFLNKTLKNCINVVIEERATSSDPVILMTPGTWGTAFFMSSKKHAAISTGLKLCLADTQQHL